MAPALNVLRALARITWRDFRSFRSLEGNLFFAFAIFLTVMQPGSGSLFLLLFGGLVLLLLSEDPLRRVPPQRLRLWPFSAAGRARLRTLVLLLSPVVWIAAAWAGFSRDVLAPGLLIGAAVCFHGLHVFTETLVRRQPRADARRCMPLLPGRIGGLATVAVRQMFVVLDTWIAISLSAVAAALRVTEVVDASARPIFAMLIVLALGTYAQSLFGLDGPRAGARYGLFGLRGWEILTAKNLAFLGVAAILTAPADPAAGVTAAFAALAVGNRRSVLFPIPQRRWRFASGELWPAGVFQIVGVCGAVGVVVNSGPLWATLAIPVWTASVFWYGRRLRART